MSATSLMYWQEKMLKSQPREVVLLYEITGAKAVSPLIASLPALVTFDAIADQSTIDNFLGTSSEFTIAKFDATAMGTDAFGGVVAMLGQADLAVHMVARIYSTAGGVVEAINAVKAVSSLTDSSLTVQYAKGSDGNLGFRLVSTGLDALTSGLIEVRLGWISK